jgi:hypothetical protein
MDIEEFVEQIIEAYESESNADYGDPTSDKYIRDRGVRARIYDILELFAENITSDRIRDLEDEVDILQRGCIPQSITKIDQKD